MLLMTLWSTQSFAAWTEWYDLASKKDMQALNKVLEGGTNRYVYKRVQCKAEGKTIMMRVDYRSIFEGGFYTLQADFWKKLEPEYNRQKKRGVTVISRSDVETNRGLFTCQVWRQSGWG